MVDNSTLCDNQRVQTILELVQLLRESTRDTKMFKLVALLMLVNAVVGKAVENPEIIEAADTAEIHLAPAIHATSIIHEPTLAKVGDLVHSVPTAVSHQSSTIVHNRANIVTPIVTPALKAHITPLVSSYVSPLVRSYPSAYPYGYYYDFHPYGYKSVY